MSRPVNIRRSLNSKLGPAPSTTAGSSIPQSQHSTPFHQKSPVIPPIPLNSTYAVPRHLTFISSHFLPIPWLLRSATAKLPFPSQISVFTIFTVTSSSQVPAFTILTPKKILPFNSPFLSFVSSHENPPISQQINASNCNGQLRPPKTQKL